MKFANGILDHQHVAGEFHKHLEAVRKRGSKPVVIAALDTREQAGFVIRRIHELRANDGVTPDLGGSGTTGAFAAAIVRHLAR